MKHRTDKRHLDEIVDRKEPGAQPVVDVVVVIGDVVGQRRHLRLGAREGVECEWVAAVVFGDRRRYRPLDARAAQRAVVLDRAFERFPGQVEAVELGVTPFEPGQDPQGVVIVRKPAEPRHCRVQGFLAGMAERGMAEIVGQRQGLGQILVEAQRPADRARDLRHFEAVGQPGAVMVALVVDKDLRLVDQPAKRGRMDDAVAVALKRRAHRMLGLRMEPPAGLLRPRRIRRKTNQGDHPSTYAAPTPTSIPPVKPG